MVPRRIVLMPHGMAPDGPAREALMDAVVACGGDVARVIDSPANDPQAFGKHVAHVAGIRRGQAPLVFLTKTSPIALAIVGMRKMLEGLVPPLMRAAWVVFVDPTSDPTFEAQARTMGSMTAALADTPTWTPSEGRSYLLVAPGHDRSLNGHVSELVGAPSSRGTHSRPF